MRGGGTVGGGGDAGRGVGLGGEGEGSGGGVRWERGEGDGGGVARGPQPPCSRNGVHEMAMRSKQVIQIQIQVQKPFSTSCWRFHKKSEGLVPILNICVF